MIKTAIMSTTDSNNQEKPSMYRLTMTLKTTLYTSIVSGILSTSCQIDSAH